MNVACLAMYLKIHPMWDIMHLILNMECLISQPICQWVCIYYSMIYYVDITLMVYLGMPVFSSKPHCLDCDPEYFKNVSGFQPDRKKHGSWVGIEPVSNLMFTNTYACTHIYICGCHTVT